MDSSIDTNTNTNTNTNIYIIIFIISFFVILYINYFKKKNEKQKLILYWKRDGYHIHHWITYALIIFIMICSRYTTNYIFQIFLTIFFAFIIEGFLFNDVFKIYYKNCEGILCD